MQACATGQHIKTATLSARKAGKGQQEYLTFKFHDVLVSSFQTGGTRGDACPDRLGVVQLRQDRGRVQAAEVGRLARLGHRVQVRPEGEQDLLARCRRRSRGARPRRPAARAPRPAARGERRTRRSSSRGCCGSAGYESLRIQERLATGDQLLARSPELPSYLRRLGDADELAVLLRLFLLGVPVARTRFDDARRRTSFERSSRAPGCSSQRRRRRPRRRTHRPARRAADRVRSRGAAAGARRPRPRRAPSVRRPRAPDRSRRGRARARPLHRQRHPGDPARRARRARRRDRRQRARASLRGVQRGAQRRRQRRDAARQLLRAGRGRAVRPRRREPAVRRLAGERVPVPRRRDARRRGLGARRAQRAAVRSRPARSPAS